jgi:hypothetical protein
MSFSLDIPNFKALLPYVYEADLFDEKPEVTGSEKA